MPSFKSNRCTASKGPVVAITIGDPFGIGPEVVLKAMASQKLHGLANFVIVGDKSVLFSTCELLKTNLKLKPPDSIVDLNLIEKNKIRYGRLSALSGRASLAYIDCAIKLIKEKRVGCLVTAPVSKAAISQAGIKFLGHTEYLAKKFNVKSFAMMLIGGPLRVTLVTRHIPINSVSNVIAKSEILNCIDLSHKALKRYFGVNQPKIWLLAIRAST
ncbi:MAG: hypothetical protein AMJ78_07265 [Omnitrophica WOR_2 bacterium SM23_29]|nr:MAG: hypothetical protein AMJ78_07265 [Omnitrophica WOR_2 bacterium SM23_29]